MFSVKVFNSNGKVVHTDRSATHLRNAEDFAVRESSRKRNWRAEVYFGSILTSAYVNGMKLLNPKPVDGA